MIGLPYAAGYVCDSCGSLVLICPLCGLHFTEKTDADGEQTTNEYGEHFVQAHEGRVSFACEPDESAGLSQLDPYSRKVS